MPKPPDPLGAALLAHAEAIRQAMPPPEVPMPRPRPLIQAGSPPLIRPLWALILALLLLGNAAFEGKDL